MKRLTNILIALVLLALLLGYMMTYTVRFNETTIVTTFGSATDDSVVNAAAADGQTGDEAGLHFKWPWPIQQVARRYDTRIQTFEGPLEQISTADGQTILVGAFVDWRIGDPLAFYNSVSTIQNAQSRLRDRVRDASNDISRYRFGELLNPDPARLKLDEIGRSMRQRVQRDLDGDNYGIDVMDIKIKRMVLPQEVTTSVFEAMITANQTRAEEIRAEGQTEQSRLIAAADSDAQTIGSFAESSSAQIIAEGEQAANRVRQPLAENPELAIFLAEKRAWADTLRDQARIYMNADLAPFDGLYRFLRDRSTDPTAAPATPTAPSAAAEAE